MSTPREIIPTIELSNVDTKLSYREFVLREQDNITMEKAEKLYEKCRCVFATNHQIQSSRAIQERDQFFFFFGQ